MGLEQQAGSEIRPQLVSVAHAVLGLEDVRLRLEAGDARDLGLAKEIIPREGVELLRQQRREGVAVGSRLDADDLRVGVVATNLLVIADHLARRPVEIDELLVLAGRVDHVHYARSFDASVVRVDERPGVVELLCRSRSLLQPADSIVGERERRPNERGDAETRTQAERVARAGGHRRSAATSKHPAGRP